MDIYTWVILLTLVGFSALAAVLLVPVYLFVRREEQISEQWTPEALARTAKDTHDAELEDDPS